MDVAITKTVMVHLDLTLEEAIDLLEGLRLADQVSPAGTVIYQKLGDELAPWLKEARR